MEGLVPESCVAVWYPPPLLFPKQSVTLVCAAGCQRSSGAASPVAINVAMLDHSQRLQPANASTDQGLPFAGVKLAAQDC